MFGCLLMYVVGFVDFFGAVLCVRMKIMLGRRVGKVNPSGKKSVFSWIF